MMLSALLVLHLLAALAHGAPAPAARAAAAPGAAAGAAPLVCGAPGTLQGPLHALSPDFGYWTLRLFWPPALYYSNVDGAALARQEVESGRVASGWWVHGLWNSELDRAAALRAAKPPPPGWELGACANDALVAANFTPATLAALAAVQPGMPGNFSMQTGARRRGAWFGMWAGGARWRG